VRFWRIALTCLLATPLAASTGAAQRPPPDSLGARFDSIAADTTDDRLSPRTAMIRSWLVPGWGQSSAGAYFRGGVFFAAQSGSWYMLLKTFARLGEARAIERERIRWVSDSLQVLMAEDPDGVGERLQDPVRFQAAVDSSQRVIGARNLVESRQQQQQDWITGTLFLTLLSGVDAFVAAHLADAPITLESTPLPRGGVSIRFSIPFGRPPARVSPVPASGAVWERRWPEP
jgi:hypothetical protein